mmetsp:Transcript_33305/g.72711  ORF Transcript_33305/g.72711 Transcript_33305/m.72711 type:complete len:225 (-) Transcript_33305:57-731(-)
MTTVVKIYADSTCRSSPKWSIHGRGEGSDKGEIVPGPGKYGAPSVEEKFRRSSSYCFSSSVREGQRNFPTGTLPGPGTYCPDDPNQTSERWAFGTCSRMPKQKVAKSPDPGTYDIRRRLTDKSVTIGTRREGKRNYLIPGPGFYTAGHAQTTTSEPRWVFGNEKRDIFGKEKKTPGPGSYETTKGLGGTAATTRSSPTFSMSSRRRPVRSDVTPGPTIIHSQFG